MSRKKHSKEEVLENLRYRFIEDLMINGLDIETEDKAKKLRSTWDKSSSIKKTFFNIIFKVGANITFEEYIKVLEEAIAKFKGE